MVIAPPTYFQPGNPLIFDFRSWPRLLEADVVVISPESASAWPLELSIVGGMALGRAHTRGAAFGAGGWVDGDFISENWGVQMIQWVLMVFIT